MEEEHLIWVLRMRIWGGKECRSREDGPISVGLPPESGHLSCLNLVKDSMGQSKQMAAGRYRKAVVG